MVYVDFIVRLGEDYKVNYLTEKFKFTIAGVYDDDGTQMKNLFYLLSDDEVTNENIDEKIEEAIKEAVDRRKEYVYYYIKDIKVYKSNGYELYGCKYEIKSDNEEQLGISIKFPEYEGYVKIKVHLHRLKVIKYGKRDYGYDIDDLGLFPKSYDIQVYVYGPSVVIKPQDGYEYGKLHGWYEPFYFDVYVEIRDSYLSTSKFSISSVNVRSGEGDLDKNKYKYSYKIEKRSYYYRVNFSELPHYNGNVYITVDVEVDGDYLGEYPEPPLTLYLVEYTEGVHHCEIETDKTFYPYGTDVPITITVTVYDLDLNPLSGCKLTDNWGNEYNDKGNGTYTAFMTISHLSPGGYKIYVKADPGPGKRTNLSQNYIRQTFYYIRTNTDQTFVLDYPLVEDVTVKLKRNNNEYKLSKNEYKIYIEEGRGILKILRNLQENDQIIVTYRAYTDSGVFYVGNPEPIICTVSADEETKRKYKIKSIMRIYIPFLQSREEACEIARTYLEYLSKPSRLIITNNKWGD